VDHVQHLIASEALKSYISGPQAPQADSSSSTHV
jgi:hypothetical protein